MTVRESKPENEVACTIEIIISRYSYALAILKSCSGHLYKYREAARAKSTDQGLALIKEMMERLKNALIRIYKMWGTEAIILVGLSHEARPQRQSRTTRVFLRLHRYHEKVGKYDQDSSRSITPVCWSRDS